MMCGRFMVKGSFQVGQVIAFDHQSRATILQRDALGHQGETGKSGTDCKTL